MASLSNSDLYIVKLY